MDLALFCTAPPGNLKVVSILGVFCFVYAVFSLLIGNLYGRGRVVNRLEEPFQFWTGIISLLIGAGVFYFPYWYCNA